MKILCVIDSLGSGGAQRQLVELALGFKNKGHEVSFLIYHNLLFFKDVLDRNEIPVKVIEEPNLIKRIIRFRKYIRKKKVDSVLSFLESSNLICEISSFPRRRWSLVVGERSSNPDILSSFRKKVFRRMHVFADYVVANSYRNIEILRVIQPNIPNEKYHVIYNIVDEKKWTVRQEDSYLKERVNLCVAASHQYLKNAKGLIYGVSLLSPIDKNKIRVSWYGGESSDNSYIEAVELIKRLGLENVISFYPAIENIKQAFIKSDAIGLFSFYEGLPNVVCEAMMLGKPVISSAVSDVPLLLNKEMTFDAENYESIADRIRYLINVPNHELKRIGKQNNRKAKLLFDGKTIIDKYLKLMMK